MTNLLISSVKPLCLITLDYLISKVEMGYESRKLIEMAKDLCPRGEIWY